MHVMPYQKENGAHVNGNVMDNESTTEYLYSCDPLNEQLKLLLTFIYMKGEFN